MYQVTLEVVRLQDFDDENRHEQTLRITFVEFSGRHTFVMGDADAQWNVNTKQPCEDSTICTVADGDKEEMIKIGDLKWWGDTTSDLVSVNGGDYKLEFRRF